MNSTCVYIHTMCDNHYP